MMIARRAVGSSVLRQFGGSARQSIASSSLLRPLPIRQHANSRRALALCRFSTAQIPRKALEGSDNATSANASSTVEPRLSITFTCAVQDCNHRSTHEFTRRSYERGVVIVQCPNCKNRHLIADHLSWFTDSPGDPRTIEEIIAAKGGKVKRGVRLQGEKEYETLEVLSEEETK